MVRKAFKMFLYPGMEQEYERRHNLLWPEMKEMIQDLKKDKKIKILFVLQSI